MAINRKSRRRADRQRIDDLVIAAMASQYSAKGYVVHTNPNQQKNQAIAGMYPDVVVMSKRSKRPKLVVEVETEDSVSESEAARQWIEYDQHYDARVLAVPAHAGAAAKSFIEDHDLRNVRLVTWSIDFGCLPR